MTFREFQKGNSRWSRIGYGMWGLASWTGNNDLQTFESLKLAVENGVNFFDTAWAYGEGKSEKMLGELIRSFPGQNLFAASKIPPKNLKWPALSSYSIEEVFPVSHILEYTKKSLENLGTPSIDLMQFHVWNDEWVKEKDWQKAVIQLKEGGKVKSFGISINRWEPENVLKTLETGLIDSVQVVYNIFDQYPEDKLFPYCQLNNIAIIARVPFDEGSLTGSITHETSFPAEDWRAQYFNPENLKATLPRVEEIKKDLPEGMTIAELALRFILQHEAVSTVIPGMRKPKNVLANVKAGDGNQLPQDLYQKLRRHRWDRTPKQNPTP
jgi:aryl-alcohol dehydrogenase-like predicted oxidoreductase